MEVIGEQSVLNYLLVSTRYARCSHRWGRSSSRRKVASALTASLVGRDHDRQPSGPSWIGLAQGLASEERGSCLWRCLAGGAGCGGPGIASLHSATPLPAV